ARIIGSRKSGPHLNTCTRLPWRACSRARAAVTVVLPCPDAGAAISNAGQLRLFIAASQGESSHGGCKERHPPYVSEVWRRVDDASPIHRQRGRWMKKASSTLPAP